MRNTWPETLRDIQVEIKNNVKTIQLLFFYRALIIQIGQGEFIFVLVITFSFLTTLRTRLLGHISNLTLM